MQEYAESLLLTAERNDEPSWKIEERLSLYKQIVHVSLVSLAKLGERVIEFVNFALFAAAEYVALGGQLPELTGFGAQQKANLVERFNIESVLDGKDTNAVHTAFRLAEHILHDDELAQRCARRLELLISELPSLDTYQERDLQQVRKWLLSRP
jgi:hypothetical protein